MSPREQNEQMVSEFAESLGVLAVVATTATAAALTALSQRNRHGAPVFAKYQLQLRVRFICHAAAAILTAPPIIFKFFLCV